MVGIGEPNTDNLYPFTSPLSKSKYKENGFLRPSTLYTETDQNE